MIVGSSSGVTFDLFAEAGCGGKMIHDILCGWGAADISEADEEEFHGELGVGRVIYVAQSWIDRVQKKQPVMAESRYHVFLLTIEKFD
jgi:hypothetical protein